MGYWCQEHVRTAVLLAALPLVVLLVLRPAIPLVLGTALLPFLALGISAGGAHITVSDTLFGLALVGTLLALLLGRHSSGGSRGLAHVLAWAAPFAAWLLLVAVDHASLDVALNTFQDYQLVLFPLLLGGLAFSTRVARVAMAVFVASALVLAVLWMTTGGHAPLLGQKNPAGQFMADGVLVTLALAPSWYWRFALIPPLVGGVFFTQSRGALVGAIVGAVVVLALRGLGTWRRSVAAFVLVAVAGLAIYSVLPDSVRTRVTDFSQGADSTSLGDLTASQYALRLRTLYREQGWALVDSHPVFGVGPGNYVTGAVDAPERTVDPHDVIIRTAGDLGYPGLVTFGLLVVGSVLVVLRRRSSNPYAIVAIAVQAAIVTHGFFDVYWVRGTPVLGWLLIGMAVNRQLEGRRGQPRSDRRGLSPRRPPRPLPETPAEARTGVGDR